MRPALMVFAIGLLCQPALAGEGFSISLGVGGGFWDLPAGSLSKSLAKLSPPRAGEQILLTDELADGLAVRFAMAYNIMGVASVELGMTGHGWNLGGGDAIGGSGHASLSAHFHPFELFMPERDFDATVFLGGGYAILGGGHDDDTLDRGLDGGLLEVGLTGRYFFASWFSLGAELRFGFPFFTRWHVDWEDGENYGLKDNPDAMFIGLLVTTSFHFAAK